MSTTSPKPRSNPETIPSGSGLIVDHRDRILHEQAAALEHRQRNLLEQTSIRNSARLRIRIWEQLHQMGLPLEHDHRLIPVIAAQTDLSVEQVSGEQMRRAMQETTKP